MNKKSKELVKELNEKGYKVRFNYRRFITNPLPNIEGKKIVNTPYGYQTVSLDAVQVIEGPFTLKSIKETGNKIWEFGGIVKVSIKHKEHGLGAEAESKCAVSDIFDKEIGKLIAIGRAKKLLGL